LAEEKLVNLMENDNALIVCSDKFPYHEYLRTGSQQQSFIKKINDATQVKHNNNPVQCIWRAIKSEILQGSLNICSARVNEIHRVLFIAKHSTQSGKIVIYCVADDPHHKYNLDKIKASYASKKRICGSKEDWTILFDLIRNETYIRPSKPKQVTDKKEDKRSPTILAKPLGDVNNSLGTLQENIVNNTTTVETAPEVTLKQPVPEEKSLSEFPEPVETEPAAESKTETPAKKKKKKKKKPPAALSESLSENRIQQKLQTLIDCEGSSDFADAIDNIFRIPDKGTSLKFILGLLELGMNPDMEGREGECLMRVAMMYQHVEAVKLLLEWDASLLTWYGYNQQEYKEHLPIAISNRDNIEIIRALVQKTKEKGKLNDRLIMFPNITILHLAALCGNLEAVQVLIDEGADRTVKDDEGSHPSYCVQRLFKNDSMTRVYLAQARGLTPKESNETNLFKLLNKPVQYELRDFNPMTLKEKYAYNKIKEIFSKAHQPLLTHSAPGMKK